MSELEERLNAVLSDPDEMSRLAAMAQKIMGNLPAESAAAPEPTGKDAGSGGLAGMLPSLLSRLAPSGLGAGKKPLADALAPYLSEERARRLARAVRIASAAHIALAAFSEWGRDDGL